MVGSQPTALTTWLHPPNWFNIIIPDSIRVRPVHFLNFFKFMSKITQFSLNDEMYFTDYKLTLQELIYYFNYDDSFFVLEYNNLICNKKDWNNILIQKNDQIEIITIVGGG
jgi:thiamine biosynthesis protein ThiS